MAKLKGMLLALFLLVSCAVAQAQAAPSPGLLIYNVWVRPTAPEPAADATPEAPLPGTVTGAFMTIENTGDSDYQLVGVSDDFAEMSQLHEMTMDDKGVMRMHALDIIDIPAGQTVLLASGGYHVMLMNVAHDIYPGQAVALTLTFADSSGATFDVPVAAIATDDPPQDDPLIVANALAQPDPTDDTALDISLILDNRGDADDTLTGVSSDIGTTVLLSMTDSRALPYTTVDVPAQQQTAFTPDGVFIRLSDPTQPPGDAFPLTLTFASGKTITVAVPVAPSGANS